MSTYTCDLCESRAGTVSWGVTGVLLCDVCLFEVHGGCEVCGEPAPFLTDGPDGTEVSLCTNPECLHELDRRCLEAAIALSPTDPVTATADEVTP